MRERHVLLGVARARSEWFSHVGQWATSGAIPAEFVRCVSLNELRSRLESGRAFSAVLLDAGLGGIDRDLITVARSHGAAPIVIDDGTTRDWKALGADAVLSPDFNRDELLEVLSAHATMVSEAVSSDRVPSAPRLDRRDGRLIAVTGTGGVGTSTTAIALAQGLAAHKNGPDVLLADLCRVADQAMLHDSRVVVPSIQELTEAHRASSPRLADVRDQTFIIAERGYRLLLGLRRPRHWVTIRPQALRSTMHSLRGCFDLIVCDIEADFEGEEDTGSVDIEERHLMARMAVTHASVVVAVGRPDMKGLYGLVRVLLDLLDMGVPAHGILPVVTPSPKGPRQRADITTSLSSLLASSLGGTARRLASPVFLPNRQVDEALRDGVAIPKPLPEVLAGGVNALLARDENHPRTEPDELPAMPQPVPPGSLPEFSGQEVQ